MIDTPNLALLARSLESRWRIDLFLRQVATTLTVSAALSVALTLAIVVFDIAFPLGRALLLVNGAAIAVALVQSALKRRTAQQLLSDADRVYETKEVLSSAIEFSETEPHTAGAAEQAFRNLVVRNGDSFSTSVDPATVYPRALPNRAPLAIALFTAMAVLLLLNASGWFTRPAVEMSQEGLLLEDAGQRLAQRSDNDELTELANEIRRLGERLRSGDLDAEEARRRIEQLRENVEEQVRNLERIGELATNQEIELPPEAENTIRSALRSGMSEGDVVEFFMRMRAGGETLPETLRALDGAAPDVPPDANFDMDSERIQELLDQLNSVPAAPPDRELAEQLNTARQALQQAGTSLEEITEGDESEFGTPRESGAGSGGGTRETEEIASSGESGDGDAGSGQRGGEMAVADAMNDTFTRIEDANPIFREIEGVIGEGTIRDVITRELPAEAISVMTESEREVAFERVIEEAVGRANTPPDLQTLVRNYFLRITLGKDQGESE